MVELWGTFREIWIDEFDEYSTASKLEKFPIGDFFDIIYGYNRAGLKGRWNFRGNRSEDVPQGFPRVFCQESQKEKLWRALNSSHVTVHSLNFLQRKR